MLLNPVLKESNGGTPPPSQPVGPSMHSIQSLAESSPPKLGPKLGALSSSPSKQISTGLPAPHVTEAKEAKPNPFMFSPTKPATLNPVLNHVSLKYFEQTRCLVS